MLSHSLPHHSSPLLRGMGLDRVQTRATMPSKPAPDAASNFGWHHLLIAGGLGCIVAAGGFLLWADQSPSHAAAMPAPSALMSAPGQASGDEAVGPIGNPVNWDAIEASPDPSPASVAAYGS